LSACEAHGALKNADVNQSLEILMSTYLQNLIARRDAIGVELAALDATKSGGKVNASLDGESHDHLGYKRGLYDELIKINSLIAAADGPFEHVSRAIL